MSRDNDERILRGRLAVTQALWDHEREQILEALGVDAVEINPRAWSTEALVEEIKDCIEGHEMLASVLSREAPPANKPPNRALSAEPSREEVEDWLNDVPLFDA
jgi:hypothetical protein